MTDIDYIAAAEQVLATVEAACDRFNDKFDVDIDNQRTGSMVTMRFGNQSEIIINLQKPLQEIWLAARSGGFHYRFLSEQWRNTKNGNEFFNELSRCASEQAGLRLEFTSAFPR